MILCKIACCVTVSRGNREDNSAEDADMIPPRVLQVLLGGVISHIKVEGNQLPTAFDDGEEPSEPFLQNGGSHEKNANDHCCLYLQFFDPVFY